jgi:hypothetical protein
VKVSGVSGSAALLFPILLPISDSTSLLSVLTTLSKIKNVKEQGMMGMHELVKPVVVVLLPASISRSHTVTRAPTIESTLRTRFSKQTGKPQGRALVPAYISMPLPKNVLSVSRIGCLAAWLTRVILWTLA